MPRFRAVSSALAASFFLAGALSASVRAEDAPAPAAPPALPPPAAIDTGTGIAPLSSTPEAVSPDGLVIPNFDKLPAPIQGCRRAIQRGDFDGAIQRLEDLKTKKLKENELAAVVQMLDYAYAHGVEPRVKEIERSDPLKALLLVNLMRPPGKDTPYPPRFKQRIMALEAKARAPEAQVLVKAGHEFNRIYELFQSFPDEAKPKLEAFVAGHAGDVYGQMAQRVLEGKTPVEEPDVVIADGAAPGTGLDQASLAYPSEFGTSKGPVPKSMAELRKVCVDFLDRSERALKADTADAIECDAKFWKWFDATPAVRIGLLLAKNPVPAAHAINLAKFYRKLGPRACTKYAQLVLASSLTESDVSIGGHPYKYADFTDSQRKVGEWIRRNQEKVPYWKFLRDSSKYLEEAGGTQADLDAGKLAFTGHVYPPAIPCSRLDNVRRLILQQETSVPGAAWPIFPLAQTPYILLDTVASSQISMRERDYIWALFNGRVSAPGDAPPGEQPGPGAPPRVGAMLPGCKYGWEYTRPDVVNRRSLWHPNTLIRMVEDGGVCGRLAGAVVGNNLILGSPNSRASQPGHCARMYVTYGAGGYGAGIDMGAEDRWMDTGPYRLGYSPATLGHDGEAATWHTLTRTVNRVGMQNYHASLVVAYIADTVADPGERRNWLELAVRLNPYHVVAIEKIWAMAAEHGVNSLNKAMQEAVERLALKKGKGFDDLELDDRDRLVLRKVMGPCASRLYDVAMDRAGNVSSQQQVEYKLGEGYAQVQPTAEEKELAYKAGLGDEKKAVKEDLELMYRYIRAFHRKGLTYGFSQKVFLKHLSRVDREIGRKMLNNMLEDAFKDGIPSYSAEIADSPLYVVILAIDEMDSDVSPKERSKGLTQILIRLRQGGAYLFNHVHPEIHYGKTLDLGEVFCHPLYVTVNKMLDKALRASGPEGVDLAERAKRNFDKDEAVMTYQIECSNYPKKLAVYKDLLAKVGGDPRKLIVGPPDPPKRPIMDKKGNVIKPGAKKVDPDAERLRRGEGLDVK